MNQLDEVVKFVLYKCRALNNPITETLASFVAQTILNKSNKEFEKIFVEKNKFYLEEKLNESELNELKDLTLDKLSNQNTPQMKTIQLQITYDSAYMESELKRQERIKQGSLETGKLIDEVVTLEIKNAKDFEGLTVLYRKIFNFLLYKNKELIEQQSIEEREDSSIQFNIEKDNIFFKLEVAAALESVIPRAALGPFVSLNPSEKVTQLVELSNLVIGIRLFNKKIGKGGVSLCSVEQLTEHLGRDLLDRIRKEAIETIESCDNYTTFFTYQDQFKVDSRDTERYKDELTFLRQYLSYILSLQEDVELSENQIESNSTRYSKEIEDLKHLLENKSSAPKEQVYPKFATVAQSHTQLFEEKKISVERMKLFELLSEMRVGMKLTITSAIIKKSKELQAQIGQQQENLSLIQFSPETGVQRMLPQNTPDFMQTPLDYLGFCVWSLVKKDGLLIPGKPSIGVYRYKDRNCVFSSELATNEFLSDPNQYINGVIDQCRRNPQLIHLLRMEDTFKALSLSIQLSKLIKIRNIKNKEIDGIGQLSNKLMVDKSIQTPTHFVEKKLDPNYCWNEWELRRKAIQMANIRKRQTKASQTILSHFKVDSEAQVYEKREKSTNTGLSKGQNPLRPRNYITGLRDLNNK